MKDKNALTDLQFAAFRALGEAFQKDNDEVDVTLVAATEKATGTVKPIICIKRGDTLQPLALLFNPEDQGKYVPVEGTGYTDKHPVEQVLAELLNGLKDGSTTIDDVETGSFNGQHGILVKATKVLDRPTKGNRIPEMLAELLRRSGNTDKQSN